MDIFAKTILACVGRINPFDQKGYDAFVSAICFAPAAHAGQKRKYSDEDYITHPLAVAVIVSGVPGATFFDLAIAVLHDTIEDTETTSELIHALFGPIVGSGVDALTDISRPEDGNRAARKAIDKAHLAKASPRIRTIKLADIYHNASSIIENDPKFAKIWLAEKADCLEILKTGDRDLYSMVSDILVNRPMTAARKIALRQDSRFWEVDD